MRDFQTTGRSAVYAANGMCATSHPLAAKTAIDILQDGGNAADAAIAAAVLLGICEPQMTGLGGDMFALIKPAGDERIVALNGSGRAPAGLSLEAMRAAGTVQHRRRDVFSVTVPGAVDAFCRLSEDYGLLGLKRTLAPAIRYAEEGVPVAPRVASDWARSSGALTGRARDHYLLAGEAPATGALFRAPGTAEVLRRIAREGRSAFYDGEVAQDMIDTLLALGGQHGPDDFLSNAPTWHEPISDSYGGLEVLEHPPNGQGATALLILNILKHFDLGALDPWGPDRAHIELEAARLAYDTRNRILADPDHTSRLEHMLSHDTAAALADLIDMSEAAQNLTELTEATHKETVYLCVVDRDGMAVSMIYSIFSDFGSGIASDKFGILFHNRGAGFSLTEGHPNAAAGGKRPMHTIIPGMLRKDGAFHGPFGVMGGPYQAHGHARLITNLTDFGMDPQTAIDGPRIYELEGQVQVERGYSDAVRHDLARRGHLVVIPQSAVGGAQMIRIGADGVLEGASDPRKDGCALGY